MPNKRINMRKIRDILRLRFEAGLSFRQISQCADVSTGAIQKMLKRLDAVGVPLPLPEGMSESRLASLLYPESDSRPGELKDPDWADIHMELCKKGVTRHLLWEEYCQRMPVRAYSYSQFCYRYHAWCQLQKRSMRQQHFAGEKCFIDYCGPTVSVNLDGRREIIGMGIGESEAKAFWLAFLLSLKERGLQGVKLVISDSHSGLKAAIQQVFSASWQRCRVHFMRNVLSRVSRANQSVVRAALQQVFVQTDEKSAHATWREVAGQLEKSNPAVTEMMDEAEADVLAYFSFPKAHRVKLHSTNTLERLNKEVKRRADVVGIFPNEESITRLLGAVLTEQNEEWLLQNRYLPQHTMAETDQSAETEVIEALPLNA